MDLVVRQRSGVQRGDLPERRAEARADDRRHPMQLIHVLVHPQAEDEIHPRSVTEALHPVRGGAGIDVADEIERGVARGAALERAWKSFDRHSERRESGRGDADVQKRLRLVVPPLRRRDLRQLRRLVHERSEELPGPGPCLDAQSEVAGVVDTVALQDRPLDVFVFQHHFG
jgi:hypothetical protein